MAAQGFPCSQIHLPIVAVALRDYAVLQNSEGSFLSHAVSHNGHTALFVASIVLSIVVVVAVDIHINAAPLGNKAHIIVRNDQILNLGKGQGCFADQITCLLIVLEPALKGTILMSGSIGNGEPQLFPNGSAVLTASAARCRCLKGSLIANRIDDQRAAEHLESHIGVIIKLAALPLGHHNDGLSVGAGRILQSLCRGHQGRAGNLNIILTDLLTFVIVDELMGTSHPLGKGSVAVPEYRIGNAHYIIAHCFPCGNSIAVTIGRPGFLGGGHFKGTAVAVEFDRVWIVSALFIVNRKGLLCSFSTDGILCGDGNGTLTDKYQIHTISLRGQTHHSVVRLRPPDVALQLAIGRNGQHREAPVITNISMILRIAGEGKIRGIGGNRHHPQTQIFVAVISNLYIVSNTLLQLHTVAVCAVGTVENSLRAMIKRNAPIGVVTFYKEHIFVASKGRRKGGLYRRPGTDQIVIAQSDRRIAGCAQVFFDHNVNALVTKGCCQRHLDRTGLSGIQGCPVSVAAELCQGGIAQIPFAEFTLHRLTVIAQSLQPHGLSHGYIEHIRSQSPVIVCGYIAVFHGNPFQIAAIIFIDDIVPGRIIFRIITGRSY